MPSKKQPLDIDMGASPKTEPLIGFEQLGLQPSLVKSVMALGYEAPTPIQTRAIPPLLEGKDVMGQAQTGTGKTAAFSLPLLQCIDVKQNVVQALVLTPTRELALQVAEAVHSYAKNQGRLHVLPIYGGASMKQQLDHLRQGVQVVVGTPGRVMDHLKRGSLSLAHAKFLVLDEADEMLKMGFFEDVNWIMEQVPKERQIALFSATFPTAIQTLARRYMQNPVHIRIEQKTTTVDTIDQKCIQLSENQKLEALTRLLEVEPIEAVLIFTRTKVGASGLAEKLLARGYRAESLHSDLSQSERQKVLRRLQSKQSEIVVATDVAARGLDVQHITHVINYDMPNDGEVYTHRIGRTGRAGKSGISILFVTPRERAMLRQIEKFTRRPITTIAVPTQKAILVKKNERFKQTLMDVMSADLEDSLRFVTDFMEEQEEDALRVAAAAIRLAMLGKARASSKKGEGSSMSEDSSSDDYWPEASASAKTQGEEEGRSKRSSFGRKPREEFGSSSRPKRDFAGSSSRGKEFGSSSRPKRDFAAPSPRGEEFGSSSRPKRDFAGSSSREKEFGSSSRPKRDFAAPAPRGEEFGSSSRPKRDFAGPASRPKKDFVPSRVKKEYGFAKKPAGEDRKPAPRKFFGKK